MLVCSLSLISCNVSGFMRNSDMFTAGGVHIEASGPGLLIFNSHGQSRFEWTGDFLIKRVLLNLSKTKKFFFWMV